MRVAIIVIGVALLTALASCDSGCANEIASSAVSPDGKHVAIMFNRNCGATTGSNIQLSIATARTPSTNEAGNVLIADGTVGVKFVWLSASVLSVRGLGGAKLFKQERLVDGVSITYD